MAAELEALLQEMSRRVAASAEDIRNLKTDTEALIQTTTSRVTSETIRQMDVFVLATHMAEKFQKISFHLRLSADSMQKAAELLISDHLSSESAKRKDLTDGSNDSHKDAVDAYVQQMADLAEKFRELSRVLRSTADILQNAAESLIPDHLSSESRKRKLNVDDSNEWQKKEEVDDKCVQDQLDVDGYENFHADMLSTSADLAGKSVAEQRQITEAEWVLLSENSRRSYIERGDTGEEGQPSPSKKRRVN